MGSLGGEPVRLPVPPDCDPVPLPAAVRNSVRWIVVNYMDTTEELGKHMLVTDPKDGLTEDEVQTAGVVSPRPTETSFSYLLPELSSRQTSAN